MLLIAAPLLLWQPKARQCTGMRRRVTKCRALAAKLLLLGVPG
jgi:type II secretory pathway component PulM